MNFPQRILQLFEDLYDGDPWIDVTLIATLENITAEQAAYKKPGRNSIWEITNHLVSWRLNVLERVKGIVITSPDHNYFLPVEDTSPLAWQQTLANLHESQEKWVAFFQELDEKKLEAIYAPNNYSNYKHIHGLMQHDAYHLGQIVMLAKHPD